MRLRKLAACFPALALMIAICLPQSLFADNQPHMQAALDALKTAEKELSIAEHDKGGHRAKALALTRQAIRHVEEGVNYDNTHKSPKEKRKAAK